MEAIDAANEAEDFQAVGMRCRETLVALVKSLQRSIDIPEGQQRPQASNVVDWFDLIALNYAAGARNERVRSYLRSTAKETWQLLNWLTHTSSAGLQDAQIALDATSHLLTMTTRVVSRKEAAPPSMCPKCGSYRIAAVFDPDIPRDPSYVSLCQSCGWNDLEQETEEQN